MKVGISTACLHKTHETEESLALLNELGAETCEIYLKTFYEYRPEFAKKFCKNLGVTEVHSVRVAPYNFEPQLFSESRRVRGDGFYWLDQVLRSAQLFGAKNYSLGAEKNEIANWDAYIGEIRAFCARYGINLCVKDGVKPAKRSVSQYSAYLNDSTGAISHAYLSVADFNDYGKIIKDLKSYGFDGAVIIKTDNCDSIKDIKTSTDCLKKLIYNIK